MMDDGPPGKTALYKHRSLSPCYALIILPHKTESREPKLAGRHLVVLLSTRTRPHQAAGGASKERRGGMGNSLRCCLACMLPCGALDVVRVVHLSGRVDEFACPLAAADVLAAHPNHALTDAWSAGATRKIVILSPDSELKRGRIYFLIPSACSAPAAEMRRKH